MFVVAVSFFPFPPADEAHIDQHTSAATGLWEGRTT